MGFELCGKRTGQKRRCKHDGKGYWVFAAIGCQRQPGFRQKIIEQDDTQKSGQHTAGISAGKSGSQKHPQQVNHDDIGICKAERRKTHPMTVAAARIPMVRSSSHAVGNAGRMGSSRFLR